MLSKLEEGLLTDRTQKATFALVTGQIETYHIHWFYSSHENEPTTPDQRPNG